jgi:hypothetical protein
MGRFQPVAQLDHRRRATPLGCGEACLGPLAPEDACAYCDDGSLHEGLQPAPVLHVEKHSGVTVCQSFRVGDRRRRAHKHITEVNLIRAIDELDLRMCSLDQEVGS